MSISSWHGRYELLVTDELVAFIEAHFVAAVAETERDRVRQQAMAEARQAVLEITADGTLISQAQGEIFYRVTLSSAAFDSAEIHFEKAPGLPVTLRRIAPDTLEAVQPGKPMATFHRIR